VTGFVIVGAVGLGIVVVSLLFGDNLDRRVGFAHFHPSAGLPSAPVIGTFLAAFGFGAALLSAVGLTAVVAGIGGLAAGITLGAVTLGMVRALVNMPAEETPPTTALVGSLGTVVTQIPVDGPGEVSVTTAGHLLKLDATADAAVSPGTTVVVVDVTSPTSVVVTESGF
jgi:xanthosine utilization system XapX-like protein